jgi:cation diffusion facilitator CzcD-associated flavoprotein CzcO
VAKEQEGTLAMAATPPQYDAVIVGAGFAGMYMLHRLREIGLSVCVIEAGDDVGGTWYWNRYPGARCDVESIDYSYQFSDALQQEWNWSERYAPQPEILAYAQHVAERFDLRRDIQFSTRVEAARFNETTRRWALDTDSGDQLDTRFCIFATGCLSVPLKPDIKGVKQFNGPVYYTGEWPHHEVDFHGKRVAVIGTGSSGMQSIPIIAEQAEQLTVYQRSPNYSIPARNAPMDPDVAAYVKANYADYRARNQSQASTFGARYPVHATPMGELSAVEQEAQLQIYWDIGGLFFGRVFGDLMTNEKSNFRAQEFIREKIREQVKDPQTAELLCPHSTLSCKRMIADTNYYQTFNRPNVSLVDINTQPIEAITATGIRSGETEQPFDCIVMATGFDAMTGALTRIDIRGRDGQSLREKWEAGPNTLLGLQTAGFPNLFMITGPGSPSVLSNMLQSIEQHVDWITGLLQYLHVQGWQCVEAQAPAEEEWMKRVAELAGRTLYSTCNSWYLGANVEGKARVFTPYLNYPEYVEHCKTLAESGYPGFSVS